jgi:hypothetical protein
VSLCVFVPLYLWLWTLQALTAFGWVKLLRLLKERPAFVVSNPKASQS